MLHRLSKRMCIEERVSTEWKTYIIIPMYINKGDKLQCHDCTEISLLGTEYKILTTFLNKFASFGSAVRRGPGPPYS